MDLVRLATRHLFFTGKGGVGKTSVACATAIGLADAGKRVLLVSTDPASNLDEVLGASLGTRPVAIPGVPSLHALNLDPEAAARAYRERVVGPYRGLLPPAAVRSMEEQLSGACTVEIAAFDEFARLLGDAAATAEYDHVLFDTAPTGHTCGCSPLPSAWTGFVEQSAFGTSCLGPLAGLEKQRVLYDATVKALADPARTTMVLVARPSLRARGGGADERGARGARHPQPAPRRERRLRSPRRRRGRDGARAARGATRSRPCRMRCARCPARRCRSGPGHSSASTRSGASTRPSRHPMARGPVACAGAGPAAPRRRARRDAPGRHPDDGKGRRREDHDRRRGSRSSWRGAACASTSARPTPPRTSPARSASSARAHGEPDRPGGGDPGLHGRGAFVRRPELDEKGRALLEEDLRSPCTEEVAVFRAFARTVAAGEDGIVVLDTAPTGHTILLLDAAESYHREVLRQGEPHARAGAASCSRGSGIPGSRGCCSSRCPRRRPCTRPARSRTISRAPASRRSRGW